MSNEPPPEKKLPLHRRFLPTTLAGKVAAVTALALVVMLVIVWTLRLFGPQSVALAHAVSLPHRVIEVLLVIVIPVVLYWGVRRWNQVIEGEYPDIDRAWEAGISALEAKGVSPSDYPIFLVLGSSGDDAEHGLMEALETKLTIHGVPDAAGVSHALQWYMTTDAIYLFCPGASSLSALMGRWSPSSMKVGSRRSSVSRLSPADAAADPSSDSGGAVHGAHSSQGALPRIQRASQPSPSPAPVGAKAAPAPLAKESTMRQSTPSPAAGSSQPQPYLGTIQHHSADSSPQESSMRDTAAVPPRTGSAFDIVPSRPQPSGPAKNDALRPAPRYEGTISFDQYPSSQPAKTGAAGGSTSVASAGERSGGFAKPGDAAESGSVGAMTRSDDAGARQPTSTKPASIAPKNAGVPLAMPRAGGNKKVALPASLDTSDQLPRLRYVCKLLKRARRPMCGINGAVTLIPFELSRVGPLQLSAIAQSARSDVETIQETLGVRSPVTAVLVGLEQDKGFAELVRRLQSGLLSRRLGGRFDLRSRPTPDELNTHSDRLCDAFEDWVYRLFSREDGLAAQRGNRKLYALTCKIRHELKPRLRIVLGQAFGCESSEKNADAEQDESFFFSGCYFAATGANTGQAAFVKGVLKDKLMDEQSKVQWTNEARRRQRYLIGFTLLGWAVVLILLVLLIIRQFN